MAPARLVTAGPDRLRRYRRRHAVTLIAICAVAIIMAGFVSLIFYGGVATNRITEERETALLQRAVDRRLATILEDVTSATVWTEAYEKSVAGVDRDWLDVNFGQYYAQYLKHDLTLAVNGRDRPFYASLGGEMVPTSRLGAFTAAVRPVLARLREREAARLAAAPDSLGFDRHVSAGAAVRVGREVYLVQASTVVPEPGYRGPLATRHPVVVTAVEVGPRYLGGLDSDYGLRDARLLSAPPANGAYVALRDVDGSPIGAVIWTPDKPGVRVYENAKWTILTAATLISLMLILLVRRMDQMTQELQTAREEADAANRAKSEFLANISHEIRTPLNGVLGMAHAMATDKLSAAQRERLTVVRQSGAALLALLNDVLDLSKIQAGKLDLEETPFNVDELCRTVCATFEQLAAAKDLTLEISVETEDRLAWKGDALRLRQILSNLISNAVKFTHHGVVRLVVKPAPGGLTFEVRDTGIGLDQDQIRRLFQKFSQADASTTRRYGGSGLGLAISHELVKLMGGVLRVHSTPGEGSVFAFTLPLTPGPRTLAPTPADGAPEPLPVPARALRILAAEDNPTNQLVLRALLQPFEVELHLVDDGRQAVQAFREASFDLVLMDIHMPEMDGIEATRTVRRIEAETQRARTPVVALSANVMTHQVEEYRAAGMDACLGKPVELEKLYGVLQLAASGGLGEAQTLPESGEASTKRA